MNKNGLKLVEILGEKFGTGTVTKAQIVDTAKENGIPYPSWIFYNKDLRVSRGVYRIPGQVAPAAETQTAALQPNTMVASLSVESEGFTENLVPEKDGLFVPFGNFKTVKQIIQSKMFYPIFITGLSGNGKTFSVEQACAQTKREVIRVNFTIETDEDDLIGGFRLVNGETKFFHGPVIKAMQKGAVLLLDEIDLGNPAKIMCLQSILEGKGYFIKKTGEYIKPSQGFTVVATANTKGKGSDDGRFIGTNILNEAFLERFPVTCEQEYPPVTTEKRILNSVFADLGETDTEFAEKLVDWADIIRKTFYDGGVDEVISTRRLVHIAKAYSIFKDRMVAIEMCTNRFDEDTKQSFKELYTKLDDKVVDEANTAVETAESSPVPF
jgi:MoxR-like ATPase